jgi:hypothetical protein
MRPLQPLEKDIRGGLSGHVMVLAYALEWS